MYVHYPFRSDASGSARQSVEPCGYARQSVGPCGYARQSVGNRGCARRRAGRRRRRGVAALEEIMILAVMFPLAAAAFFVGLKFFQLFHFIIYLLVTWPLM